MELDLPRSLKKSCCLENSDEWRVYLTRAFWASSCPGDSVGQPTLRTTVLEPPGIKHTDVQVIGLHALICDHMHIVSVNPFSYLLNGTNNIHLIRL